MSDDHRYGLTVIAFVGSVFSPYYAWARRRGRTDPLAHCAINAALYGDGGHHWTMTERTASALQRGECSLQVGPSRLCWHQGRLCIHLHEVTAPIPRPVRGSLVIEPPSHHMRAFPLDQQGRHVWHPIAPLARVEVRLTRPALSWSGHAYVDCNIGSEPLADAFRSWTWSRTIEAHQTRVYYDVVHRDDGISSLALAFDRDGGCSVIDAPPLADVDRTMWGLPRRARSDRGTPPRLMSAWEDGPFYARALVGEYLGGKPVLAVHETLSLDRFAKFWVQALLPFRMPRRWR